MIVNDLMTGYPFPGLVVFVKERAPAWTGNLQALEAVGSKRASILLNKYEVKKNRRVSRESGRVKR
jgi:hypothetical protein